MAFKVGEFDAVSITALEIDRRCERVRYFVTPPTNVARDSKLIARAKHFNNGVSGGPNPKSGSALFHKSVQRHDLAHPKSAITREPSLAGGFRQLPPFGQWHVMQKGNVRQPG